MWHVRCQFSLCGQLLSVCEGGKHVDVFTYRRFKGCLGKSEDYVTASVLCLTAQPHHSLLLQYVPYKTANFRQNGLTFIHLLYNVISTVLFFIHIKTLYLINCFALVAYLYVRQLSVVSNVRVLQRWPACLSNWLITKPIMWLLHASQSFSQYGNLPLLKLESRLLRHLGWDRMK